MPVIIDGSLESALRENSPLNGMLDFAKKIPIFFYRFLAEGIGRENVGLRENLGDSCDSVVYNGRGCWFGWELKGLELTSSLEQVSGVSFGIEYSASDLARQIDKFYDEFRKEHKFTRGRIISTEKGLAIAISPLDDRLISGDAKPIFESYLAAAGRPLLSLIFKRS